MDADSTSTLFPSDTELVAALRANDPSAFEVVVRRYGGRMTAAAKRYLRCDQECADAVQDAFVSAFQAIDHFEQNSQLGTWLHRIVINACLMKLRSRSRRPETSIEELLPVFDATGHQVHPVCCWKVLPEDRLQDDETRVHVRRCIEMLPVEYRTVLMLRDIEEVSTEEVAEALQTTPGAVKTRLHRARQALRTLLEPYFEK